MKGKYYRYNISVSSREENVFFKSSSVFVCKTYYLKNIYIYITLPPCLSKENTQTSHRCVSDQQAALLLFVRSTSVM